MPTPRYLHNDLRPARDRNQRVPKKKEPKPKDPDKEWAKVRSAWNNDREAWERYSGFR